MMDVKDGRTRKQQLEDKMNAIWDEASRKEHFKHLAEQNADIAELYDEYKNL